MTFTDLSGSQRLGHQPHNAYDDYISLLCCSCRWLCKLNSAVVVIHTYDVLMVHIRTYTNIHNLLHSIFFFDLFFEYFLHFFVFFCFHCCYFIVLYAIVRMLGLQICIYYSFALYLLKKKRYGTLCKLTI